jgi:folate-binding protein YgfZ
MTHDTTRGFIEVAGEDRVHFLQGILTQDVTALTQAPILFSALLTPQGKIAHDFFLLADGERIILDTAAATQETLLKRLGLYKLRAKVTLRDISAEWQVGYHPAEGLADPRHPDLPRRIYRGGGAMAVEEYHRRRIALGVPDGATDLMEDVALDAGYDLLNAVSFSKGCYVGQEVTARMHYKQIARRGFYIVEAGHDLPAAGTPVHYGELIAGTLRGSLGRQGLAMLKFGEVAQAQISHTTLTVDNHPLHVRAPEWLAPKLALFREAHAEQ